MKKRKLLWGLFCIIFFWQGSCIYAKESFSRLNGSELVSNSPVPQYLPLNSYGSFFIKIKDSDYCTEQGLVNLFHDIFGMSLSNKFEKISEEIDALGIKHSVYQHFFREYAVEGQMVLVHSRNGRVFYLNGTVVDIEDEVDSRLPAMRMQTRITTEKAIGIAKRSLQEKEAISTFPVKMLFHKADDSSAFELAYKISVESSESEIHTSNIYVSVQTGEVLSKLSLISYANISGKGESFYRGVLPIEISKNAKGLYTLIDPERGIETYDATYANSDIYNSSEEITSSTPAFDSTPAIDVHWGVSQTYDYYKKVHDRFSYDNKGSVVKSFYNPAVWDNNGSSFPFNASAMRGDEDYLVFGRGGDSNGKPYMNPLVTLDLVAHEYSHLVIANNGKEGLKYQGESGALNEGFADIFGTSVEFFSVDNANWTLGEGLLLSGTYDYSRNMANPKLAGWSQPNTYKGKYWASTLSSATDNGGVHSNSGVLNYWYYLLCEGGEGTNDKGDQYVVEGMGIAKAEQIAYLTLMTGLSYNAQFIDAYMASIAVAEALFGKDKHEYNTVIDAWYAVGIGKKRPNMGIDDFGEDKKIFSVFPNPVIDGKLNIITNYEQVKVEVYSMLGQKVAEYFFVEKGEHKLSLNDLQRGSYILKALLTDKKIHTEKIIVM